MKYDLKREIGLRTKLARKRLGLTQEALAEEIQRTVETISKIERGVAYPSMDTLEALADALKTPVREFLPEPAMSKRSALRAEMELQVREVVRSLGDAELEVALNQIRALAGSGIGSGPPKR